MCGTIERSSCSRSHGHSTRSRRVIASSRASASAVAGGSGELTPWSRCRWPLVVAVFGALYPLQSAIAYCARHVVWLSQSFLACVVDRGLRRGLLTGCVSCCLISGVACASDCWVAGVIFVTSNT